MNSDDRHVEPGSNRLNEPEANGNPAHEPAEGVVGAAVVLAPDGRLVIDRARLADALLPAMLAAGRVEMKRFDSDEVDVTVKCNNTPVTEADHEAEAVLSHALARIAPGILVVGEESADQTRKPEAGEPFFLVDPLDGTKDFIAHQPEFTVNVALVADGRPVFGMIYAPALNALFVTQASDCAIMALIECHMSTTRLADCRSRPISTRQSDPDNLVAFVSRNHADPNTLEMLKSLGNFVTTPMGSSLKFCLIARGYGDVYIRRGPTSEWDTAAGEAILEAAGGEVTTFDGGKLSYGGGKDGYLNPHFAAWGDQSLRARATLW